MDKVMLNGEEVLKEEMELKKKELEENASGTIIKEEDGSYKTRLYS